MKTRPRGNVSPRGTGVEPGTGLPENKQEPVTVTGFAGAARWSFSEPGWRRIALSDDASAPISRNRDTGSRTAHRRTGKTARTGQYTAQGAVNNSAAIPETEKQSSQSRYDGTTNTTGQTQQEVKRGETPELPRCFHATKICNRCCQMRVSFRFHLLRQCRRSTSDRAYVTRRERHVPRPSGGNSLFACIRLLRRRVSTVAQSVPSWNEPNQTSQGISAVP